MDIIYVDLDLFLYLIFHINQTEKQCFWYNQIKCVANFVVIPVIVIIFLMNSDMGVHNYFLQLFFAFQII